MIFLYFTKKARKNQVEYTHIHSSFEKSTTGVFFISFLSMLLYFGECFFLNLTTRLSLKQIASPFVFFGQVGVTLSNQLKNRIISLLNG